MWSISCDGTLRAGFLGFFEILFSMVDVQGAGSTLFASFDSVATGSVLRREIVKRDDAKMLTLRPKLPTTSGGVLGRRGPKPKSRNVQKL